MRPSGRTRIDFDKLKRKQANGAALSCRNLVNMEMRGERLKPKAATAARSAAGVRPGIAPANSSAAHCEVERLVRNGCAFVTAPKGNQAIGAPARPPLLVIKLERARVPRVNYRNSAPSKAGSATRLVVEITMSIRIFARFDRGLGAGRASGCPQLMMLLQELSLEP